MINPGGRARTRRRDRELGGNVRMVGCVGEAFGDELKSVLEGYGVDTRCVKKLGGVSSGIAVIVVVDGDNRIILDAGANARVSEALVDEALAEAEAGDYLVAQLEIGLPVVEYALEKAKEKGMVTMLNPRARGGIVRKDALLLRLFYPQPIGSGVLHGHPSRRRSFR